MQGQTHGERDHLATTVPEEEIGVQASPGLGVSVLRAHECPPMSLFPPCAAMGLDVDGGKSARSSRGPAYLEACDDLELISRE